MRHSESIKVNNILNSDSLQLKNEKVPLSVNGEELAEEISNNNELLDIDVVYSSNHVRAIATAKYIAFNNNSELNVDERFNERKHGVNDYSQLPKDFEQKQLIDDSFKVGDGECQNEVKIRMHNALNDILRNNVGKKIAIVSHATAITFLLSIWCDIQYDDNYLFKEKVFFDGKWNYCETFKLVFDNNELLNIENIKLIK